MLTRSVAVGRQVTGSSSPSRPVVLRCPSCGDVAVVVGMQETRLMVEWHGVYEIAR